MKRVDSLRQRYGPWALVTGGARGIGAEFAEQIAAAGLNLVLVDIEGEQLERCCDALRARHDVEVRSIVLDLAGEDFLDSLLPQIEELPIGLLVCNAGIAKVGPFLPQSREFLLTQLHVNVRAVMLLTHAIAEAMRVRGRGGIIVVSSGAALSGSALNANYAAAKAYGLILAESLWAELQPLGIDVLGYMPTTTDTAKLYTETPSVPRRMIMSTEETVRIALDALGRTPSLFAGRSNRVMQWLMSTLLPRRTVIRLGSNAMRSMSRPRGG